MPDPIKVFVSYRRADTQHVAGRFADKIADRFQVFMDGRTLIYAPEFWERLYVSGPASRRAVLSEQLADAAIVPATGGVLREPLLELGWTATYSDARAVVLVPPTVSVANVAP